MTNLEKYQFVKAAGIGDWMPDTDLFQYGDSTIGNAVKGVGNFVIGAPVATVKHTLQGDFKKALGGLGFTALTFMPGGAGVRAAAGKAPKLLGLKNSMQFTKPGWGKGMKDVYWGTPFRKAMTLGLPAGLGIWSGNAMQQNPNAMDMSGLVGPALGIASLFGRGGTAGYKGLSQSSAIYDAAKAGW